MVSVTTPSEQGKTLRLSYRPPAGHNLESLLASLNHLRDLVAIVSGVLEEEYRIDEAVTRMASHTSSRQSSALDRARWWVASDLKVASISYADRLQLTIEESTRVRAMLPVWKNWLPVRERVSADPWPVPYLTLASAATDLLREHVRSNNQPLLLQADHETRGRILQGGAAALIQIEAVG